MNDDHQRPDTMRPEMPDLDQIPGSILSLQEAAARAGANERTLRRWIKSGRLSAVKDDGQYRIAVADLERARHAAPDATRTPDTIRPGARISGPDMSDTSELRCPASDMPASDMMSGFDLTPLVDHIASLEEQVQRLTEVTTMWQIRARQAEEQLLQLQAGPDAVDPQPETLADVPKPQEVEPVRQRSWWRRLWE